MNTPLALEPRENEPVRDDSTLGFVGNLRAVINKIYAAANIDEILPDISRDICTLFNADRLTIYTVSEDKSSIAARIKTGLDTFQDLRLPINEHSVAGYVSLHKKTVNLRDVYDRSELNVLGEHFRCVQEVDKRSGYRTKQMLVAPILHGGEPELFGVVQIINSKNDLSFSPMIVERLGEICQTLAIAFKQRQKQQLLGKTRYDHLIIEDVISAAEFALATRQARESGRNLEDVLIDQF